MQLVVSVQKHPFAVEQLEILAPPLTDEDGDGLPDVAELTEEQDRAAFLISVYFGFLCSRVLRSFSNSSGLLGFQFGP